MRTKTRSMAAGCLLNATACAALAAAPVYDVTCLDCDAGRTLMPLAINGAGVVVATDDAQCGFPDDCNGGQGYILDHGNFAATPSFDESDLGSTVAAINGLGVTVGSASLAQWPQGPFGYTWDGTSMTNLGDPINDYGDMYWSHATGINDKGHVVGSASAGYHAAAAFIYKSGLMTALPSLANSYVEGPYSVFRINGKDHVVGTSLYESDDSRHAWISIKGITEELAPGSGRSEAYAINEKDQVAGFMRVGSYPDYNDWAVIWKGGTAKLLNTLAGYTASGQANAINDDGSAVGSACSAQACVPFVYAGKKMYDLNTRLGGSSTGWVLQTATGINDAGVIVGIGTFSGDLHAYMATPAVR